MGQRSSKLAPRTMEELKAQTNFTAEELQDWYKEFRSSWPKGVLTVEEFKKAYSSYFPLGDASEFAKHVFRVFDRNDDGRLDFREFICGFSVGLRGSVEEKLKFSFRIYDVDGNGYISPEEMVEIFTAFEKTSSSCAPPSRKDPREMTTSIFRKMDSNADRKLSLEEFIEGAKKDPYVLTMLAIQ
ncbi:neurocalcin homolog [Crassostrea virginica]